jgi:hypothetical protein
MTSFIHEIAAPLSLMTSFILDDRCAHLAHDLIPPRDECAYPAHDPSFIFETDTPISLMTSFISDTGAHTSLMTPFIREMDGVLYDSRPPVPGSKWHTWQMSGGV